MSLVSFIELLLFVSFLRSLLSLCRCWLICSTTFCLVFATHKPAGVIAAVAAAAALQPQQPVITRSAGCSTFRATRDIDPRERKRRSLNALLNKLTIDNFGVVCEKVCLEAEQFDGVADLELLSDLLFNKVSNMSNNCGSNCSRNSSSSGWVCLRCVITSVD